MIYKYATIFTSRKYRNIYMMYMPAGNIIRISRGENGIGENSGCVFLISSNTDSLRTAFSSLSGTRTSCITYSRMNND